MTQENQPSQSQVKFSTIDEQYADQRVDNYLLRELKGVPKSRIYKLLRSGQVRVNKKRVKPDYRLQEGDVLRIPPVRTSDVMAPTPNQELQQQVAKRILYEDDGVLVLNKPAGVPVHGGSGFGFGMIETLRALFPQYRQLELAHRLDKDTSGCLVVAKKRSVLKVLHEAFRDDSVEKIYWAVTQGKWAKKERYVNLPLRKYSVSSGERKVVVDEKEGKVAQSWFRPINSLGDAELVEVRIETGRTHQIRVHAQALGHPIAGDERYGDKAFNKEMKQRGLNRLFLHARSIKLKCAELPEISVAAPLDEHLDDFISKNDS